MLNAIKYCHGRKIAHRDLKPENFLLLGKPTENIEELSLKLIDFGLSFMWKESMLGEIAEIKKNKMVGTVFYSTLF
jgi:serine/threonine protein kinase